MHPCECARAFGSWVCVATAHAPKIRPLKHPPSIDTIDTIASLRDRPHCAYGFV
eukprot:m.65166 g.65166  ORF g.65166 m.65166 type:complete len:54 (+) comp17950_c0_seq3:913-1074(+)